MDHSRRSVLSSIVAAGAASLGFSAASLASSAPLAQKVVSDPGTFWKPWGNLKTNYVADSAIEGGAAQRLTTLSKPPDPWDIGGCVPISQAVHKDDLLLLTFWARVSTVPAGSSLIMLKAHFYELPAGPTVGTDQTVIIGTKWKPCFANCRLPKDYSSGQLAAGIMFGTAEQVIDFGRVTVLNFGPKASVYSLPRN